MAELSSAAPTSGGVRLSFDIVGIMLLMSALFFQLYFWTYSFSSPRCRNLLSWIVGCKPSPYLSFASRTDSDLAPDTNTIGSVSGVASIDWGCAVQVMAAGLNFCVIGPDVSCADLDDSLDWLRSDICTNQRSDFVRTAYSSRSY